MLEPLSKILDVVFNGRPADAAKPTGKQRVVVDLKTLVKRKSVHVIFEGKLYKITCERKMI